MVCTNKTLGPISSIIGTFPTERFILVLSYLDKESLSLNNENGEVEYRLEINYIIILSYTFNNTK